MKSINMKTGEYRFDEHVYIVSHLEGRIAITKGEAFYEMSWVDVEDLINNHFVFETGKLIRDLDNPVYYLFYKLDIAASIHEYEKENSHDENYWRVLEKTPDLLASKEDKFSSFCNRIEREAVERWESRLL